MKVVVFGLGYVGFTAACCISSEGHRVVGIDVSEKKVRSILGNQSPIAEPGVDELLAKGLENKLIGASTEIGDELDDADIAIVCVGTPSAPDGGHDMRYIADVSRQIGAAVKADRAKPLTVVYRSTIRPGTLEELVSPIFVAHLGENFSDAIELVYNPEFLREATAVFDYFHPPKIVIGTVDAKPSANMDALNANLDAPTFYVGLREAEITKFVDNSWHAVKVAFANEVGRVCVRMGISAAKVHEIFVSDTKLNISPYYLRPGGAFGGSCLPKDVRALQRIAADAGANTHLVDSLLRSNDAHKHMMFEIASRGMPEGGRILMIGLAFKAQTDDLRESPNVDLARLLLQAGYSLSIFDPAIDATKLIGANLGYAYSNIPTLERLLVARDQIKWDSYDRIIVNNATAKGLDLPEDDRVLNLGSLR